MAVLDSSQAALFLMIAGRVVPEVAGLDESGRAAVLALVERMLGSRNRAMRRQFVLFLSVLRWSPVLRYGRPFDSLSHERQDAVLRWFFRSPLAILRKGFWGVKTLVFLGYYGRHEVGTSLAYEPERNGNLRLHA